MPTAWTIRDITKAILPVLCILTIVEVGSGFVLERFEAQLLKYPALLALVPVTIGTAGNLGSILAARLSTALHLGTLVFAVDNEPLLGNILAILALSISIFPIVGVGTWGLTTLFADPALTAETVILISITSGTCLAVIAVTVALLATYLAYRFELDPDNVVLPVVTNVCDVLGVVVLVGVAQLFI